MTGPESCPAVLAHLSTPALAALRAGLACFDPDLRPGNTVFPWASSAGDMPPETCCPISYGGWKSLKLTTCRQVANYFADIHVAVERDTHGAMQVFLAWVDGTAWDVVRAGLLAACDAELAKRGAA